MNCAGSPVKHTIQSSAAVVAFGDGLVKVCEGKIAKFVVDSKGEHGDLAVQVNGTIEVRTQLSIIRFAFEFIM